MSDENKDKKMENLSKFAALILTAVGIVSGINTYQIGKLDSKISATESKNKWDFKVYDSVVEVVNSQDEGKILAVKIMVENVASDAIKNELKRIVENELKKLYDAENATINVGSTRYSLRAEAAATNASPVVSGQSDISQKSSDSTPVESPAFAIDWGTWDVDIFWCESSGAGAKVQADQLQMAILNAGAKGRIRSRILPEITNQRAGYQVKGYQIRPNENEFEFATSVAAFVNGWSGAQIELATRQSFQQTNWYLSLFMCPAIEN